MNSRLLLDVNVWVALNSDRHTHHLSAGFWYEALDLRARIVFCRQTQLGLFRILSTPAVMAEEILTQRACWDLYDRWISTGQVEWADEPLNLEQLLRPLTASGTASPKTWMDAYLTAFAEGAGLSLVTFDKSLAGKARGSVLLA
jgi:uncharacterized protein